MFDKKLIKNFDFVIMLLIILITGLGLVGIGIAKKVPSEGEENIIEALNNFDLKYVKLQIIWFATGLVLMGIVISIDYHVIVDYSSYIYWICIALLLFVFLKGSTRNNAQSWIPIGPYSLQPSEFTKLAMIITFAKTLSKDGQEIKSIKDLLPVLLRLAIPMVLILKQPDFGTAMVFIVVLFSMLFIAGISYKLVLGIVGTGIVVAPVLFFTFLTEVQKNRILGFLKPDMDLYQVVYSKTAIGSGMILGKGILRSNTLSQLNFLPECHTDFIFPVIVEALGFVAGIIIIILYAMLVIRTIKLATKARDSLGSLIIIGVVAMIVAHIFENIGMTMGIMPVTGIPLPFMSYGGSFMWTNMIAFGLVLNVGMRRQKIKF